MLTRIFLLSFVCKYSVRLIKQNSNIVVFRDVLENGLEKKFKLLGSDYFNICSCSCIADVDFDGNNEILIGTYGQVIFVSTEVCLELIFILFQELLAYKYIDNDWKLKGVRTFSHSIYSLMYKDLTGDGINEIIVLTIKGVHILQHKHSEVEKIIWKKIKNCKNI